MLAPIRDYIGPQDPQSSSLLCMTRDSYLRRLSIEVDPAAPEFEQTRWIVSEDLNAEHLLNVFASIDPVRDDIWFACCYFMRYLSWHKPRQTMLGSQIEALPDTHHFKPKCLTDLSRLFLRIGNFTEQKRLITHILELERQRGDDTCIAYALRELSNANRNLNLYKEGIEQAKEALEIFKRVGNSRWEMQCSNELAWLLLEDKQLDAAEDVASRTIDLVPEKDQIFVCRLHRVLGNVYRSKGEKEKAVFHLQAAIRVASPSNWQDELFWNHFGLAILFREEEFDEASSHVEQTRSHVAGDTLQLGCAMGMQARVWYRQLRF